MKKILCFGDSNIFGYNPENGLRLNQNSRWTGILQTLLPADYLIIEEGCNNRTAFSDNFEGEFKTGYKILPHILSCDLFFIILAIGINDTQFAYNVTPDDIKNGITELVKISKQKSPNAKILLVCPSIIKECILKTHFSALFDKNSIEKSKLYPQIYEEIALENNCLFTDLNTVAKTCDIDGLHYLKSEHKIIAEEIKKIILSV